MNNQFNLQNKRIQSWIILVLVILNIVAFIFIANKCYVRFDMTQGKKYSISKATKNLLTKLDNTLVIEYYYNDKSKEISGVASVIQYVIDMLKEYENAGKGNVNVVIRELSFNKPADQGLINELEEKGIKQYSLNQTDQAEAKSLLGFSGMILKYKDAQEIIPALFRDAGFEFQVDSVINKLLGGQENVGILCSSMAGSLENEFKYVRQVLEREFKNVRVLQANHNIPPELNVLVVLGGKNLTEYDLFQIDQFILKGGKVFFAINGVDVSMSQYGMYANPADSPLLAMFKSYGVTVNTDLVGDNQSYNPIRQGFSLTRYPLWLKVKSSNFNKDNVIVNDIASLNMLWSSSITTSDEAKDKVVSLFTTTKDAWNLISNYNVNIDAYKYPVQEGGKQFDLGISYNGAIKSHFADKEVPHNDAVESDQFTGNITASGNGKFIIVACEQFLQSNFAGNDEFIFFMNGMDWLSKDGALIEIRNKGKFTQPLDKIQNARDYASAKSFIIGFSTFAVPVLFIILGVVLYIMKNLRNKQLYAHYVEGKEDK